jgi:arylsulfatase A-like enzyme
MLAAILFAPTILRAAEPPRPNIILMLADDQGWNGTSVAMHPDAPGSKSDVHKTPNLEKLAAQGMRFSAAYAPAPVCSPTRISILTGRSLAALHWTKAAPPEAGRKLIEPTNVKNVSESEITLPELLRDAGYATAHYGKWHINGGGPAKHGYDDSDGNTGNEEAFKYTDPNPVNIFGMVKSATAFMEKSKKAGKPFYIQMSWNALHAAGNANKATLAKYAKLNLGNEKRIQVAAITEDLDTGVGALLKAINDLELTGTTYVILHLR